MALPTTRFIGGRYQLREGGTPTTLGGGNSCSLEMTRETISTFGSGDAGWDTSIPSFKRAQMQARLEYLSDGSTPTKGCTADISVGGTGILELTRWTANCVTSFAEAVHSDSSCALIRTPYKRDFTLDFEALFVDPLNASAQALEDIIHFLNGDSDTALTMVATLISGHTLSFSGIPGSARFTMDPTDHGKVSGQMKASGAVTGVFTNSDAGLKALLDSIFIADIANMSTIDCYFQNVTDGSGSWNAYGAGYPSNVTFDVDYQQKVSVDLTAVISGTLTEAAVA